MNRKFYFKNILWGMCPIIISILHLIYDTPTEASIKVDLFLILSGLALPCSIYLTKTITLKYTSISFWKKPLFWSYGIYHFHLVYIMICIVLAIPSQLSFYSFTFIKTSPETGSDNRNNEHKKANQNGSKSIKYHFI